MIRFTLRLVGGPTTWVAPSFVLLAWMTLMLGASPTALSTVGGLFYSSAVWATWVTIATGNVDSDAHRDVLTAAVGSAAKLHATRALAVISASAVATGLVSIATVAKTASDSPIRDLFICLAVSAGGSLLGVSFGTLLHCPLLRQSGLAVLIAVMCLLVTIISPFPNRLLAGAARGDGAPAALIVAVASCWCALVVCAAAGLAARRSR